MRSYSERVRGESSEVHAWSAVECALLVLVFAVTSWFPVDYVLDGGGPEVGSRAWPVTSWPLALVTAVVSVVAVDRLLLRRRPPVWVCALTVAASWCLAAGVYLRWVPRYRLVTDRATALEIGWRALASGQDPYSFHTQLGNPIAPLPGGLVLAGPTMTVFGDLRWYGLIWAAVLLAACWWGAGARAAAAVAVLGAVSPMLRLELYSQSDAWINAGALVLFGSLGWWAAGRVGVSLGRVGALTGVSTPGGGADDAPRPRGRERGWAMVAALAGALFGLALAYRVILAPVALPLAVAMWRRVGTRAVVPFLAPAALVAVVATATPVLVNPSAVGPWAMAAHHAESPRTPYLGMMLATAMLLVTALGAWRARSLRTVWATMAASLATMVALVWWGQAKGYPSYETVAYDGALLVFTLAAAVTPRVTDPAETRGDSRCRRADGTSPPVPGVRPLESSDRRTIGS